MKSFGALLFWPNTIREVRGLGFMPLYSIMYQKWFRVKWGLLRSKLAHVNAKLGCNLGSRFISNARGLQVKD